MAEENDNLPSREDICHDDLPEKPIRFIPDPAFSIGIPILQTPELENLLNRLPNPDVNNIPAVPPPEAENPDQEDEDVEVEQEAGERGLIPAADQEPRCPEGFIFEDGLCVPVAGGNIVVSDENNIDINSDGAVSQRTPGEEVAKQISALDRSKKLFESIRYIPDFPNGSKYKFFTSANKTIKLFLSQSEDIFANNEKFIKIQRLKSNYLKVASLERTMRSIAAGSQNISLSQIIGTSENQVRKLYQLLNAHYSLDPLLVSLDSIRNAAQYLSETLPLLPSSLTPDQVSLLVLYPKSYLVDYSDDYRALIEASPDSELNGTLLAYLDNTQLASAVDPMVVKATPFLRATVALIYKLSTELYRDFPNVFTLASENIINSLTNYLKDGQVPIEDKAKAAMSLLNKSNADWASTQNIRGNPAGYNLMIPKDYQNVSYFQYLSQNNLANRGIPNVAGKAVDGYDPFRHSLGLHHVVVSPGDERINTGRSGGSLESIEDLLFKDQKELATTNHENVYYPGKIVLNPQSNCPLTLTKVHEPPRGSENLTEEQRANYESDFTSQTVFHPYVHARSNSRDWRYEADLMSNDMYEVGSKEMLASSLSSTKEYFKLSYDPSKHKFHGKDMFEGNRTLDAMNEELSSGLVSSHMAEANNLHVLGHQDAAFVRSLEPYFGLEDGGDVFRPNNEFIGSNAQEDIRNYYALGFSFKNWLYGFGVHPYFGFYKNIRRDAINPTTIAGSYGGDDYSKFMPLGKRFLPSQEKIVFSMPGDRPSQEFLVPEFNNYYTKTGTVYDPYPSTIETSTEKYLEVRGSLPSPGDVPADPSQTTANDIEILKSQDESLEIVDTPYSTNLFPVIPFYSSGNPIEYLEGDNFFDGVPRDAYYSYNYGFDQNSRTAHNINFVEGKQKLPSWNKGIIENAASIPCSSIPENWYDPLINGDDISHARFAIKDIAATTLENVPYTVGGQMVATLGSNLRLIPSYAGRNEELGMPTDQLEFSAISILGDNQDIANVEEDDANIENYYPAYMLANTNPLLNLSAPPPTAGNKAVFQDFYTEVPLLLNKKELKDKFQIKTNDHLDIEGVYNYSNLTYEKISKDMSLNRLPTPYIRHNSNIDLEGQETLAQHLEPNEAGMLAGTIPENLATTDFVFVPDDQRFKQTFVERYKYPMFVQMEFSSKQRQTAGLVESMSRVGFVGDRNSSYSEKLLKDISTNNGLANMQYEPCILLSELSQNGRMANDSDNSINNPNVLNINLARQELGDNIDATIDEHRKLITSHVTGRLDGLDASAARTMDFAEWIDTVDSALDENNAGDNNLNLDLLIKKIINKELLLTKIRTLVQENKRTMEEVFAGVPAFSETIAFRVKKYEADPFSLQQISGTETNFYFANIDEQELVKFFDSQVKYGKLYRYEIYRTIVVIGTKYAYFDINTQQAVNDFSAKSSPASHMSEQQRLMTAVLNPILAAKIGLITFKTAALIINRNNVGYITETGFPQWILENKSRRQLLEEVGSGEFSILFRQLQNPEDMNNQQVGVQEIMGFINDDPLFVFHNAHDNLRGSSATGGESTRDLRAMENPSIYIGTISRPDLKVIEVLDRSRNIAILDKPPVPPQVNIHPVINNRRNISIIFKTGQGEFFDNPIPLEDDDDTQFAISAYSQGIDGSIFDSGGHEDEEMPMLNFKSDDTCKAYEVFRIDFVPESWNDFYGSKIAKITTENGTAHFYDTIQPNKEYYYTFRAEDVHGHVSNPTQIYKVINHAIDEGTRLEKQVYRFDKIRDLLLDKKSFRNIIEIKPSIENRRVDIEYLDNEPASGVIVGNNIDHFGTGTNPDHKPWNKKFKIRLTSRTTGRQIEVNIDYQVVYNRDGLPETTTIVSHLNDNEGETVDHINKKVSDILKKMNFKGQQTS